MTQTTLIHKTPAYSLSKIALIKRTITDGATDDELALFSHGIGRAIPGLSAPGRQLVILMILTPDTRVYIMLNSVHPSRLTS